MRVYFSYALTALWYDRQRYLPGVLAVAFSALLIALQWGMLLGMFTFASLTIDRAHADVWLGGPSVQAVDLGRPIFERYLTRLAGQPEVERAEVYLQQHDYANAAKWAGHGINAVQFIRPRRSMSQIGG